MTYATDYQNILPYNGGDTAHYYWTGENSVEWFERWDYYDSSKRSGTFLHCPNTMNVITPKRNVNNWSNTYAMSVFLGGNWDGFNYGTANGYYDSPPNILKNIKNTAYLFADGDMDWPISGEWQPTGAAIVDMPRTGYSSRPTPFFWHDPSSAVGKYYYAKGHPGNTTNLCYIDGHVGDMTMIECWGYYQTISAWPAVEGSGGTFWNWDIYFQGGREMKNF